MRPGAVRAFPVVSGRAAACERVARRYETRCLMPRIEARFRFAEDGEVPTFVDRMRTIDHACTDVTATALAACPAWPRVRPSGEYRRWLRGVRETWERRQGEIDGQRPVCPAGGASCL
jgi:hypothetical protein